MLEVYFDGGTQRDAPVPRNVNPDQTESEADSTDADVELLRMRSEGFKIVAMQPAHGNGGPSAEQGGESAPAFVEDGSLALAAGSANDLHEVAGRCGLELHPDKTVIMCNLSERRGRQATKSVRSATDQ